jgi:hypothetical protein
MFAHARTNLREREARNTQAFARDRESSEILSMRTSD